MSGNGHDIRTKGVTTGSTFRERLGVYLLGIAIGLVMLGLLNAARNARMQRNAPPQTGTPSATEPGRESSNPAAATKNEYPTP